MAEKVPSIWEQLAPSFVSGGASLVGNLLTGVGAGMSENKALEFEKEKERQRILEAARQFGLEKKTSERQMNLSGMDRLAAIRDAAGKNARRMSFRNMFIQSLAPAAGGA